MAKKVADDNFVEIEETQAALRDCIVRARELVEDSDRLVRKCRATTAEGKSPDPER